MQNSLTVLGAALIISLGVYFGLTRSGSDTKLPPVGAGTPTMVKTQTANEIRRQEDDRRRIETAINQIEIYVEDANQVSRSVAEAFTKADDINLAAKWNISPAVVRVLRVIDATHLFHLVFGIILDNYSEWVNDRHASFGTCI